MLDRGARVTDASVPAAKLLRWLGCRPSADLPEPLGSWVRQHQSDDAHVKPLVLEAPNGLLSARLLRGGGSEPDVLMLEPVHAETSLDSLRVRGLSGREALVLQAVALGRSNVEVAGELGISEHTVAKHLQNVYSKLGITNRTAAVRAARMAPLDR